MVPDPNAVIVVTTERLVLRHLVIGDAPFIFELVNTPGWLKFIGDRGVRNLHDAKQYLLNGPLESYKKNGFGLWLVSRKEDHQPIGMCGILRRPSLEYPDIGFALLPQYTGKGYAREAIKVTIALAGEKFGLSFLNAIATPDNDRSTLALLRSGFVFQKRFVNEKNEDLSLFVRRI